MFIISTFYNFCTEIEQQIYFGLMTNALFKILKCKSLNVLCLGFYLSELRVHFNISEESKIK